MKIADRYRIQTIGRREWLQSATQLQLTSSALFDRIINMAEAIPDLAAEAAEEMTRAGLTRSIIDPLVTRLSGRARACLALLTRQPKA